MNRERIEKVIKAIEANPKHFDMDSWGKPAVLNHALEAGTIGDCGTAACIAGWACVLFAPTVDTSLVGTIKHEAKSVLELSHDEVKSLFYAENWHKAFKDVFDSLFYNGSLEAQIALAQVAALRLRFFIATNGTDKLRGLSKAARQEAKSHITAAQEIKAKHLPTNQSTGNQ